MSNLNLPVANKRAFSSTASIPFWTHTVQLRTSSLGEHIGGSGYFALGAAGLTA